VLPPTCSSVKRVIAAAAAPAQRGGLRCAARATLRRTSPRGAGPLAWRPQARASRNHQAAGGRPARSRVVGLEGGRAAGAVGMWGEAGCCCEWPIGRVPFTYKPARNHWPPLLVICPGTPAPAPRDARHPSPARHAQSEPRARLDSMRAAAAAAVLLLLAASGAAAARAGRGAGASAAASGMAHAAHAAAVGGEFVKPWYCHDLDCPRFRSVKNLTDVGDGGLELRHYAAGAPHSRAAPRPRGGQARAPGPRHAVAPRDPPGGAGAVGRWGAGAVGRHRQPGRLPPRPRQAPRRPPAPRPPPSLPSLLLPLSARSQVGEHCHRVQVVR
jgi:hypothetical protein